MTDDQIEKLRMTLATAGWNEVILPALKVRADAALRALRLDQSERAKEGGEFANTEDSTLRAVIRESELMTWAFRNHVIVHDSNKRLDELDSAKP